MKKIINQIRQGDVLLERINEMPKNLKEKDKILAYGEVTGHKHLFDSGHVLVFENESKEQFVEAKQEAILKHEEHKAMTIPKGKWKVVLQREYDLLSGVRQVMD